MRYADVILPVPLDGMFTYTLPAAMAERCGVGMRLLVPFGKGKTYSGIIVRVHDQAPQLPPDKLKDALSLLDDAPVVLPQQLHLWQWVSAYYMCPIGEVMVAALPAGLKADTTYRPKTETFVRLGEKYRSAEGLKVAMEVLRRTPKQRELLLKYMTLADAGRAVSREELLNAAHGTNAVLKRLTDQGVMRTYEREVARIGNGGEPHPEHIHPLSEAQQAACDSIRRQWGTKSVVLLHGVTSSGKTEIYTHLIEETLRQGRQVLYLLPEIALTVQMTERLRRVFGDRLGIYHSRYSDAERVEVWRRQLSSTPFGIILGARSAVFVPLQRLGLVIIDEEHETSFKQQDPAPRYHARSVALVLARRMGAKALLGTATPSIESYHNAHAGKYGLVTLTTRYKGMQLPKVEVVDVRDLRRRKMMAGPFSPRLLGAMRAALAAGGQAILFQNRRGFAPMLECKVCGWVPRCKNCDVSLTYHKRQGMLTCHYCGFTMTVPEVCPNCGNPHLTGRGYGTEKIEDRLMEVLPEARVVRMDLDTTRTKGAYERIIGEFSEGVTNVLVGTQMVTKGLDFDRVAVVGILDADAMLNYPDFRAYEHAFQMMSQVAGRAGRRGQGVVILQTRDPQLPVIQQVVGHDYEAFYRDTMDERELFRYPPFTRVICTYLRHKDDGIVEAAAQELGARLRATFGDRVLGPDRPAVARVKTLCIRKIMLKLEPTLDLTRTRHTLLAARNQLLSATIYRSLQVFFDVDPE